MDYFDEDINELLKGVSRIRSFEIILELNDASEKFTEEEEAELRNKAEAFINQIDTTLADAGDKIDANQKAETMKLRDELQAALDNNGFVVSLSSKI